MKVYRPSEFAKEIGVCLKTLQRWDAAGVFQAKRTPANMRYYTQEDLEKFRLNAALRNNAITKTVAVRISELEYEKCVNEHGKRGFTSMSEMFRYAIDRALSDEHFSKYGQ